MSFPSIQQTSAIGAFHNAPKPPRKSYNIVERPVAQATHPRAAKPINLRVQTPQISHDELQQRSAKYIFNKNKTFAEGKKLATQWTNRNTYTEAFELYQHLYDLQLTSTQKIELLTTFRTLTEKGAQTVGREFYAWLRCALTRELEGSSPDLTEELKQQIIAGYQEAADLGSYYARYNLAVFYSTKLDDQGQAYTHFVKYTEEHPEKSFGFKELANFMLLHRPDERDNAVAALRKGLSIDEKDPTCAHVAAELALILAETLEKSDGTKEEVSALYEKAQKDPKGDMLTRCKAAFNLGVIQQKGWIATLHGQKKYSHEHVDLPSALELFTESKRYAEDSNAEEHMDSILLAIAETELLDDSLITQEQFNNAFNQIKSAKEQGNPEAAFLFAELMAKGSRFLNKNTKEAIEAFSTVEKTAQRDGDTILQIQSLISLGTCAEPTLGTNCLLEANRLLRDEHFADRQTYLEKLDAALQSHVKALIEENSKLKEQLAAQVKPNAVQQSWIQDIQQQQRAPKEAQDPIRLAVAQLESKQYEEVLKTCTTYLKEGGNSQNWQVWFMLAKASLETNKVEDAINFLQKCPDADRNRNEMVELQKQVFDKHHSAQEAQKAAAEELKKKELFDHKKQEYDNAKQLFHANKNEEALAAFQKLSQLASSAEYHHSINFYMARCYKRLKQLEEAENSAACAIEKGKNTKQVDLTPYYSLIAEINILRKDFQSAEKSIQSLKSYNPNAKEVAQLEKMLVEAKPDPLSLARSQLESKQYEEVKKTCLTYLQSGGDKQKWQVWFMLAKVAFETNNVDDALNFLAQCADVQATPKEIIELKVQMYNNAKELFIKMKIKEALEAFKKLLQSPLFAEKKPSLYYFTARCYKRLGKLDEAAYFAQYAINEARSLNNKADLNMFLLLIADIQICRSEFENARKTLEGLKKNGADANAVSQLEKRLPAQ